MPKSQSISINRVLMLWLGCMQDKDEWPCGGSSNCT